MVVADYLLYHPRWDLRHFAPRIFKWNGSSLQHAYGFTYAGSCYPPSKDCG